jgi:hypothetical protein
MLPLPRYTPAPGSALASNAGVPVVDTSPRPQGRHPQHLLYAEFKRPIASSSCLLEAMLRICEQLSHAVPYR